MKLILSILLILFSNSYSLFIKDVQKRNSSEKVYSSEYAYQEKTIDTSIKITAGYSEINTIQEMLAPFKGKPVFIDLWATWCDPCISEFAYSDSLYKFLSVKGIQIVYISFDRDEGDNTWKSMMRSYKLYGNHIRANDCLRDDLSTLIWGAPGGYSIPHYLFFDRTGNLLNKDAPAPSTKNELYQEIEREINLPMK